MIWIIRFCEIVNHFRVVVEIPKALFRHELPIIAHPVCDICPPLSTRKTSGMCVLLFVAVIGFKFLKSYCAGWKFPGFPLSPADVIVWPLWFSKTVCGGISHHQTMRTTSQGCCRGMGSWCIMMHHNERARGYVLSPLFFFFFFLCSWYWHR